MSTIFDLLTYFCFKIICYDHVSGNSGRVTLITCTVFEFIYIYAGKNLKQYKYYFLKNVPFNFL